MLIPRMRLWTLFFALLVVPTAAAVAQDERIIPGAEWIGKGVNLLGIHVDEGGLPVPNAHLQGRHYILKGMNANQGDAAFFTKKIELKDRTEPELFRVPKILQVNQGGAESKAKKKTLVSTSVQELHTQTSSEYCVEPSYKAFSAKFKYSSSSKSDSSTTNYYAWSHETTPDYILVIQDVDLAQHLTHTFKKHLDDENYAPAKLFQRYGTHLVTELAMGRRKEMTTLKHDSTHTTEDKVRLELEAGFEGFLKASMNTETYTKRENRVSQAVTTEEYIGFGGTPAILGFKREDREALRPIWTLCGDKNRRQQLKDAYHELAALAVISTPTVFSAPPVDQQFAEISFAVPKGYKILSGGAYLRGIKRNRPGALMASYPSNARTWNAIAASLGPDTLLGINVLAIYDPQDYWHVEITKVTSVANDSVSHLFPISMDVRTFHITGGGARIESKGFWAALQTCAPTEWGHSPEVYRGKTVLQWADISAMRYAPLKARPWPRPIGWDGGGKKTNRSAGLTSVTTYAIGVTPHGGGNGKYARKIGLATLIFAQNVGAGNESSVVTLRPTLEEFKVVGGGAATLGASQRISGSYPMQATDGGADIQWRASHFQFVEPDMGNLGDLYGFAVGMRAQLRHVSEARITNDSSKPLDVDVMLDPKKWSNPNPGDEQVKAWLGYFDNGEGVSILKLDAPTLTGKYRIAPGGHMIVFSALADSPNFFFRRMVLRQGGQTLTATGQIELSRLFEQNEERKDRYELVHTDD